MSVIDKHTTRNGDEIPLDMDVVFNKVDPVRRCFLTGYAYRADRWDLGVKLPPWLQSLHYDSFIHCHDSYLSIRELESVSREHAVSSKRSHRHKPSDFTVLSHIHLQREHYLALLRNQ